ncbi:MAG TPA: pyridoxamine 5'-phosphate oxidase family protein, partial [Acidimicrobiia bacterium]
MTSISAIEPVAIPGSHVDLLTRALHGVFTTIRADGQPQSSLEWVDFDGACPRINTALEQQTGRNLLANPKVSLLAVDPNDTNRYLQIQGDAELITDGAVEHLNAMTRKYTPRSAH